MDRYTRRWLQVLSRRNSVPEKWLAGVLAGSLAAMTPSVAARLAEEQRELKGFESRSGDGDVLDSEEKVGDLFSRNPLIKPITVARHLNVSTAVVRLVQRVSARAVVYFSHRRLPCSSVSAAGGSTVRRRRVGGNSWRRGGGRVDVR